MLVFARVRVMGSARYEAVMVPDSAVGIDQATLGDAVEPLDVVDRGGPGSHPGSVNPTAGRVVSPGRGPSTSRRASPRACDGG